MLTDSIKKNGKRLSLGLNITTITIIAGYNADQLKDAYEKYNIRYLMREVIAWQKLGRYDVAETLKNIIQERKDTSRKNKMSRLKSNGGTSKG